MANNTDNTGGGGSAPTGNIGHWVKINGVWKWQSGASNSGGSGAIPQQYQVPWWQTQANYNQNQNAQIGNPGQNPNSFPTNLWNPGVPNNPAIPWNVIQGQNNLIAMSQQAANQLAQNNPTIAASAGIPVPQPKPKTGMIFDSEKGGWIDSATGQVASASQVTAQPTTQTVIDYNQMSQQAANQFATSNPDVNITLPTPYVPTLKTNDPNWSDDEEWLKYGAAGVVVTDTHGNIVFGANGFPTFLPGSDAATEGTQPYKERKAIEAWILSGMDPALMPPTMSPMMAQFFGITEQQRIEWGYAHGANFDKVTNDYVWPIRLQEQQGGGGGGGGDNSEGGGGGGEPEGPGKPNWTEAYHIVGAPDWWRGFVADQASPELEYAALLNSMIPFLSAEDQRSVAQNLAIMYPEVFGIYANAKFQSPPTSSRARGNRVNSETGGIPYLGDPYSSDYTTHFYSKERGGAILNALELVKSKMKKTDGKMGPGFSFLQQLATTIKDFGGSNGNMSTRTQITQLMSALDPLTAMTGSESLSAFGPVAKMLTTPFMSAGSTLPVTKLPDGTYAFGKANNTWF